MLWDRFRVIGVSDGKSFCEIFSPKEKNDCENQRFLKKEVCTEYTYTQIESSMVLIKFSLTLDYH